MGTDPYPGAIEEDLQRLDAMASSGLPFEEAYALLEKGTPKPVAEEAYKNFLALHGQPAE